MDSIAKPLMSPKINNQDDIISYLDNLTNRVHALQLDVAAIKNVVCCGATLPRHDKRNSVEDLKVVDDSTFPKTPFNHASQVDSRISQTEPEGENVNQADLDRLYCISKAIQKNITKLIDVLPYQTSKLQDLLLQSESCLTENENDLIKKQPTRRDQIRQLIRFVKGRSFKSISKFLQYSRDYSPEVIDMIWQTYDQLIREGVKEERCIYCRMTNAVDIKDLADYAYEKEVLSDDLHQQMTDCMYGVGAQTQLWHQLSVLSLKDGNNKILMESILTYLCNTPKYKQYGEELKVLVKRNFRFECRCKDDKRSQMYNCNRVESFTSSIFSSSVCPTSTISDLTPRQSLRSISSTSSGNEKRKPGNPNVKNLCFRPYIKRRFSKRQVSNDKKENTSPKYIHCSQDKVSNGESTALPSSDGSEETDPKMCINFLDSKYKSQLSSILSRSESIESHEEKNDTDETTLKSGHITVNNEGAGGGINRGSATRNTWPLQPRSVCCNTEGNRFEDLSTISFDVSKEDNENEALVHSHSDYENCSFSNKLPHLSIFEKQEYLINHIPRSTHDAILPSDRHETLPTFLKDVFEENQRTSGTEDKACYSSLKRTNSIPASLTLSSQTVSETESTSSSSSSPLQDAEGRKILKNRNISEEKYDIKNENLSWETETKEMNLLDANITLCGTRGSNHSGDGELDAKFNRNQYTKTSSDFHIESSISTTFSDLETNCCPSGEFTSLEMENTTGHRRYTVHRKYNSASESDISSTANVRNYTAFRKASESLSDPSGDATKERRLHFGSLGRKVRDSVRIQRTINNRFHDFKTTKKC